MDDVGRDGESNVGVVDAGFVVEVLVQQR